MIVTMKEIIAVIRQNMINQTKEALMENGFPSITGCKVMGRGKARVDFTLIDESVLEGNVSTKLAEELSENHRLIPKRLVIVAVSGEEVKKAVDTIMSVNSTGNHGDGKIFVLPLADAIRVRTGETDEDAI
jgi:nitrogen regulatory protein PII 2